MKIEKSVANEAETFGYLTVRVFGAGGSIPIEGANVRVSGNDESNKDVIYSVVTDRSGKTPKLKLPAPPVRYSLSPNSEQVPFSTYNVQVILEDYYENSTSNIPIFAGISSIQSIVLIGKAPYDSSIYYPRGNVDIIESENKEL